MPRIAIVRSSPIVRSARVVQAESLFDVPPVDTSQVSWSFDVPVEERPWKVGLIVGPSGSGKSTVARHLWPDDLDAPAKLAWPGDRALVDAFDERLSIRDVTSWLCAVGFSSPPSWLRPFHVLSTGEQFRATLARLLAERSHVVVDEFTSVVDRQVAKAASVAVSKAVRGSDRTFVAVSCHYDIVEWLEPDWICEPHASQFNWLSVDTHRRPWRLAANAVRTQGGFAGGIVI